MNEQQHTSGEWYVEERDPGEYEITTGEDGIDLAFVYPDVNEAPANASVMAASPNLLAVLKKWERFMTENYTPEELSWFHETQAAILKAEI